MKITSVIVTYNRKAYLEKLLDLYDRLECKPENIVVVNNCSTDGTEELLKVWKNKKSEYEKYIINTSENLGGSGGFYIGIEKALELNSDWVYVSDDDAYPNKNVFYIFREYIKHNNTENIAALCSKVINNGKIDTAHRRRIEKNQFFIKEKDILENEYDGNFELDLFSYVGTMMNVEYLRKYGLTEKDYFIYYDDTEHSLRLSKKGKIICLSNAEVHHDVDAELDNTVTWKTYYGERNRLLTIKKHYGKRYFVNGYVRYKLSVLKNILQGKTEQAKLINKSIEDARKNIQGIDELYKPGWKINKKD